jgi:hypothetical protein
VGNFDHVISDLVQFLIQFSDTVIDGFVTLEWWMRGQLSQLGLTPQAQTVAMLAIVAVLILGACKLFAALIRLAVVVLLILLALHIALPALRH